MTPTGDDVLNHGAQLEARAQALIDRWGKKQDLRPIHRKPLQSG